MAVQTNVMGRFFSTGKTEAEVEADLDAALAEIAHLQKRIKENHTRTTQTAQLTREALVRLETLLPSPGERFAK